VTISVQGLATALQTLLTETAEKAAKDSRLIIRKRKLSGAGFVQALVLGWLGDPLAKLEDLSAPLGIALQSLHERFNAKAVDCLQRVLREAMKCLFEARPETIPLLRRFPEVCLEDSTTSGLPASLADEYPGCGGSHPEAGRAGLKVIVQLEAITGRVCISEPVSASTSDRALHPSLPAIPRGGLRLADLGFFDLQRMARDTEQGIFWISRVPARLTVRSGKEPGRNVAEWLGRQKSDRIDTIVTLGTKERLVCRLVAVRAPKAVAEQRLRRLEKKLNKKGRKLSEAQRMLCGWTVMITNLLDADRFTVEQLWVLYRVRWQVELLFKRWKSGGGLDRSRGRTAHRALCEFLAKLLAVLIKHWATLLRGGPLCVVSATRAGSRVKWWAGRLEEAVSLGKFEAIVDVLERLKGDLDRLPKRPRRTRPTTRQSLFAPRFAA
jgi:hypothetical protein